MIACAKQFSSAPISTILLFSYTMVASGLPLRLIGITPKPKGILTELTITISVSNASNLELDWDNLSTNSTLHLMITDSSVSKLQPIGLSLWFTSLCILIANIIHIAHILQLIIEQIVHTIYKVSNRIWWRCGFGNSSRIKTYLPLSFPRFKSFTLSIVCLEYFIHLLLRLRNFATLLCILAARWLIYGGA